MLNLSQDQAPLETLQLGNVNFRLVILLEVQVARRVEGYPSTSVSGLLVGRQEYSPVSCSASRLSSR